MRPDVAAFFDEPTNTASYVVADPATGRCAVIDSVLDFEPSSARISEASAGRIVDFVRAKGLTVDLILETHVHADHLSAAPFIQRELGGALGIGAGIAEVQDAFARIYNADFRGDGARFDRLFNDGDAFAVGSIPARALHTPGHTPACMTYVIGDAAFVGDTLFMPDYGTARCDFPGGDAATLYRSIGKIFALPSQTRVFLCHDYKAPGRSEFRWETSVAEQRAGNVHVRDGITEAEFVAMREARDLTLPAPRLIIPSVQVNIRAGHLPPPEDNGVTYLKIPIGQF